MRSPCRFLSFSPASLPGPCSTGLEFSLISPPVAINLYVVQGVTKLPLHEVARGIVPFIAAYLFCLVLLIIFPQISLFLHGTMK